MHKDRLRAFSVSGSGHPPTGHQFTPEVAPGRGLLTAALGIHLPYGAAIHPKVESCFLSLRKLRESNPSGSLPTMGFYGRQ